MDVRERREHRRKTMRPKELARESNVPVVLCHGSEQFSAGAGVEVADAARSLLDLSHLVLILQVNGLRQLHLQKAHDLVV